MRRLITTTAILVVVLVAGMSALVLLVNPNDFRGYMAQQVEQRSGYRLALDGGLRWHVWPQLSILSGRMTLTAPGATQPIVTAENMRLDVHLLPLLSHQLSVKQVMLKGAVIRLTPDSQKQRPANAPVAPGGGVQAPGSEGWSFDIASLRVADSLVIWQQPGGSEWNLRGINLALSQSDRHQVHVDFSSQLNRNQRSLQLALKGDMDVSGYPERLSGKVNELQYQLSGVDLPHEGIKGQGSLEGQWRRAHQQFSLNNISLTANDSALSGSVSGLLENVPALQANLHASNLNLDTLMGFAPSDAPDDARSAQVARNAPPPVIAGPASRNNADSPLNAADGEINLSIDRLQWRGMAFNKVLFSALNHKGLLTVSQFTGNSAQGDFSLPGSVDVRSDQTLVSVKPVIHNLDVAALLKAFALPAALSGQLSVEGSLQGKGMSLTSARHGWQGQAMLNLKDAEFSGLNFARMIQQAAARNGSVRASEQDPVGSLQQLSGKATLSEGRLALRDLQGQSNIMTLRGQGDVNLLQRSSDLRFAVTVTSGWQGDSQLVQRLQSTAIPLRIYGSWANPSYSLQVDDVLRNQLKDDARKRLEQWLQRQDESDKPSGAKKPALKKAP